MNILERETEAWLACVEHAQSEVNKPHLRIGRARPAGESALHDKNMSTTILDLPAHPIPFAVNEGQIAVADMYINGGSGQSLRAYAAIALKVPRSGCPELDEMILESRRMDYAGQALQGWLASFGPDAPHPIMSDAQDDVANQAYYMADSMTDTMLAARKGGAE